MISCPAVLYFLLINLATFKHSEIFINEESELSQGNLCLFLYFIQYKTVHVKKIVNLCHANVYVFMPLAFGTKIVHRLSQ